MSKALEVIVTGMTNLGYVTSKGVSRVERNTYKVLDYIVRGDA